MLERCEHFPFFYRAAMCVSIIQGLRQGEIASQRWERISVDGFADQHWESIRWAQECDFSGMIWLVETSWDGETKNGQDRVQALVPMAAQLLHRWWEMKGRPKNGYVFTPGDVPRKIVSPMAGGGAQGPVRTLIASNTDLSAADLVALLREKGIYVTKLRVHQIRNDIRVKLGKKNQALHRLFARGYDFGWTDTVSNVRDAKGNKTGEQKRRLGWRSKLGVAPLRYHDFRDTAASCLLSGEWGPSWRMEDVSDFLGHSSIKVTEDRYASITNSAKVARAEHVRPGYWATDHYDPPGPVFSAAISNETPGL